MVGNVADRGSGLVERPLKKEKLDDDVDVLVLGSEKKKDLIKKINNEPALERNKFAVLDAVCSRADTRGSFANARYSTNYIRTRQLWLRYRQMKNRRRR